MKADELMLGDHVQVNGEACKVISISYFDIGISASKEDFYHEHIDNIKPIPTTTEILEKNGFMKHNDQDCDDIYEFLSEDSDDLIYLYLYGVYFFLFDNINMQIEYVHQLQHALRLCGIEKEIKA